MATQIPTFYRTFFTILDPILSLFGVFANLFNPLFVLKGYTPHPTFPPAPETQLLLDSLAGFFLALAFLQAVLLRLKSDDVVVWKALQAAIVILDVGTPLGLMRVLAMQSRLEVGMVRGDEWPHFGINGVLILVRVCFLVGVGFKEGKTKRS